jgi:2-octaprenyl-6-methoxyphenol hydroxylase
MAASIEPITYPICVVGAGMVGMVAALKLASSISGTKGKIALIAPRHPNRDKRTTAMFMPSIDILESLGLWEAVKPLTAPLRTMRLIDGSQRLVRAPLTDFKASEIGLEAFGYNVPNADLLSALQDAIDTNDTIDWYDSSARVGDIDSHHATAHLDHGRTFRCQLVVAADGKLSASRVAAGITVRQWTYPQSAIVLNFTHSLPHDGVSAEFHTESGPFTQVPLPPTKRRPHRSSLVWLVPPARAETLQAMDLDRLSGLIEDKLQSSYGKCQVEGSPGSIPMTGMKANRFGCNRTVLVGEAGHVVPPIGAQGFNLGLRDIRDLLSVLSLGVPDPGAETVTAAYNAKRVKDVATRTAGVDFLNRSLLTSFLPVQLARAAGLSVLGSLPPLRKFAMWQGLGSDLPAPSLFSGLISGQFNGPVNGPV